MKKLYYLFFCLSLLAFSPSVLYAWTEEDACFELLNQAIKTDNRFNDPLIFKNGDLSNVPLDETNNSEYDFSTYSNFLDQRASNPLGGKYFYARRNNIWTIIASRDYVISQIAWFWKDSNFDFPLRAQSWYSLGDKYRFDGNYFKEYVLYTHHLKFYPYDLLSCWIVRVIPLDDRSFSEISESWYMTNALRWKKSQSILWWKKCSSGFEWQYKKKRSKDFYRMKANVCVQNYDEDDYLKMEVISIAYDNKSPDLNEYYTHPLQVEAMKNNSNNSRGLKWVQDAFRDLLMRRTCFWVIHSRYLPGRCRGRYGPWLSFFSPIKELFSFFPKAYWALDESDFINDIKKDKKTEEVYMVAYENLPYRLYQKLESIPNEDFKNAIHLSLNQSFEWMVKNRKENNIVLSPYEETFLSCNINYKEREEIVIDFLEKLNLENFSLSNLSYSNKKFGDCIIPYPDKEHLSQVIEWSFDSNQLLAQKISWTYSAPETPTDIQDFFQERDRILSEKNKKISELSSLFQSWSLTIDDFNKTLLNIENEYNQMLEAQKIEDSSSDTVIWNDEVIINNEPAFKYTFHKRTVILVIMLLFLTGIALVTYGVLRKKRNNK